MKTERRKCFNNFALVIIPGNPYFPKILVKAHWNTLYETVGRQGIPLAVCNKGYLCLCRCNFLAGTT